MFFVKNLLPTTQGVENYILFSPTVTRKYCSERTGEENNFVSDVVNKISEDGILSLITKPWWFLTTSAGLNLTGQRTEVVDSSLHLEHLNMSFLYVLAQRRARTFTRFTNKTLLGLVVFCLNFV